MTNDKYTNQDFVPSGTALNGEVMAVVLNLDVSGSITYDQKRSIERYVAKFRDVICEDSRAASCVDVAVIEFGSNVRVVQDWCNIRDLPDIHLSDAGGATDLNGGCLLGVEMLRDRNRMYGKMGMTAKKPYLVTLTDGYDCVSNTVQPAADLIAERVEAGKLKHFFLGIGDYDRPTAAELTRAEKCIVFEAKDAIWTTDFFDFLANSVAAASVSAPGEKIHVETPIGTPASPVKAIVLDNFLNS